jgi:hypothetical protein
MDATRELRRLVYGYQVSQALHAAAMLGVSDLLADGPRRVSDLATSTGADERSLLRLLRALATVDFYRRTEDGRFANTDLGNALRTDAARPIAAWAQFMGSDYYWAAWGHLLHSVRTGENAFAALYGMSVWEYRRAHPEQQVVFDAAMTAMSAGVADAVVDAYDFSRVGTVVDVGGGRGMLLSAILRACPSTRGVLFDQPDVVRAADEVLLAAGVADRCSTVGGSFFSSVPAGGDAYLLKSVIHDWPDDESVTILRNCRNVMADTSVLLLVEQVLDVAPDPTRTAFSDLNMLVMPGGQERTADEYAMLLSAASFQLSAVVPTASDVFVLEAHPA